MVLLCYSLLPFGIYTALVSLIFAYIFGIAIHTYFSIMFLLLYTSNSSCTFNIYITRFHLFSVDVDTTFSNCTTGDMRLVGSDDGHEGRLEVCVNSAWGTVCSDNFDSSDAAVACEALGGFRGNCELLR